MHKYELLIHVDNCQPRITDESFSAYRTVNKLKHSFLQQQNL
jgi:hypothetical protein